MIALMKDEIGVQVMEKFVRLRTRTYSYLKDKNNEYKKAKDTKRCLKKP